MTLRKTETNDIGAKVFNTKLAKVLILIIGTLTTCLCNARERVTKSGKMRQRTTNFLSSQKSTAANHCLTKAVWEQQNPKSWRLGFKWWNTSQEIVNLPKKPCSLKSFCQKTRIKDLPRNPEVTPKLKECWGLLGDTPLKHVFRWW